MASGLSAYRRVAYACIRALHVRDGGVRDTFRVGHKASARPSSTVCPIRLEACPRLFLNRRAHLVFR